MSNLLVEIGNTALKAAWAEGMTLGKTFRYQGEKMFEYIDSLVEKEKPAVMVVSSAIDLGATVEARLRSECGRLIVLDKNHTDVSDEYSLPSYLSSDRVASVIAARYLFKGKGSLIFDFGTTLTLDVIEPDGEYSGGNISPRFQDKIQVSGEIFKEPSACKHTSDCKTDRKFTDFIDRVGGCVRHNV